MCPSMLLSLVLGELNLRPLSESERICLKIDFLPFSKLTDPVGADDVEEAFEMGNVS